MLAGIGIQVAPSALNLVDHAGGAVLPSASGYSCGTRRGPCLAQRWANPEAAIYAGTSIRSVTMLAMCLSGGLAGFVGVNG